MADGQLRSVIRQLRRVITGTGGARSLSDAELLGAFIQHRDETAVEMLVWRHGIMVLNLCRRIVQQEQLAEDAFQATFLVFVRNAGSIGKREAVGSWLYKVAYRVAHELRAKVAKRPEYRKEMDDLDDLPGREPADNLIWRDLRSVLDEEIQRLPERYRAPIVLCYLQGHTNEEAAEILRCPKGTILSRLSRGRDQLKSRLTRRGLALSAGWLATHLCVNASSAAVPTALVDTTVKAAVEFAAGQLAAGVVSSSVAALTQGVLRAMFITKLTKAAAVLFAIAVVCLGAGSVLQWAQADTHADRQIVLDGSFRAQDKKDQPKKGETFNAKIIKVAGNKVTINRSNKDNKFDDQVLIASDKVKVLEIQVSFDNGFQIDWIDVEGGLKSDYFKKEVRAIIATDAKKNITEIKILDGKNIQLNAPGDEFLGLAAALAANLNRAVKAEILKAALKEAVNAQDKKDQPKKGDTFNAKIKKVAGNKVTINRSDKDNKFDDQVLIASDKVKVSELKVSFDNGFQIEWIEVQGGLKSDYFKKELRTQITTDAKNNIIEIKILEGKNISINPEDEPDCSVNVALDDFAALVKSVKGNKVTINKSDKDNKFDDMVLIASDKIKVTSNQLKAVDDGNGNFSFDAEIIPIKDGLKSNIFKNELRARITVDAKNIITEIHFGGQGVLGAILNPLNKIEKP